MELNSDSNVEFEQGNFKLEFADSVWFKDLLTNNQTNFFEDYLRSKGPKQSLPEASNQVQGVSVHVHEQMQASEFGDFAFDPELDDILEAMDFPKEMSLSSTIDTLEIQKIAQELEKAAYPFPPPPGVPSPPSNVNTPSTEATVPTHNEERKSRFSTVVPGGRNQNAAVNATERVDTKKTPNGG